MCKWSISSGSLDEVHELVIFPRLGSEKILTALNKAHLVSLHLQFQLVVPLIHPPDRHLIAFW